MRGACERCGIPLPPDSELALICSWECTFCTLCAAEEGNVCPNCGGELVRRPRRAVAR
jgi:hypothetical protein